MSTESEPRVCPICRAPVPPEAPQGLCPRCLLLGASLATEAGQRTDPKSPPPALPELVTAFPQLEIIELIGQGGMGFVFKARQPKLDRLVALKILPQSLATDPAFAERFAREARMLAKLNHPNIVTIHDFGQANGFFYLLMEFVDGVNLRQAMRGGRFTADQALAIVPKICDALQFAHNEGILHRDIKPENIMLDGRGRVKIADFGIAKLMGNPANRNAPLPLPREGGEGRGEGASGSSSSSSSSSSSVPGGEAASVNITETGRVLGTPHYMAPEQIETPDRVDHRADIYSLGVVFYEMLTGELPLGRFAPPSQKSAADPRLDEVVGRTLEKEPERRTQSAEEVKTQVETISANPVAATPPKNVPPRIAARLSAGSWASLRPAVIPALVQLLVILISVVTLSGVAIPRFEKEIASLHAEIPVATSLLLSASNLLNRWWFVVLPPCLSAIVLICFAAQALGGRRALRWWSWTFAGGATVTIFIAMLMLIPTIYGLEESVTRPPSGAASEQELKDRFESALKARDTNAIFALYNWQGASEKTMTARLASGMWNSLTDAPSNNTRASVRFLPLPADYEGELVRDGIRYTPNVALMGMISGGLSWEENGTNFSRWFQAPYGQQGGRYYLAGSAETRIYEPKTKDKALVISVATSNNQTAVTFSGTYTYVQNGREIEKAIKGPSVGNKVVFGDYVKSCVVRKTSDDRNFLQLVIWENGSNIFDSGWVHTTNPIVYKRNGTTSQAGAEAAGPSDNPTPAGQTANFRVTANGSAPLTYQWMFNGSNNSGTANATAADLFREYAVNRAAADLARTPNPDTPEAVVAAVMIGSIEGDPATVLGRYVLDEPRFPAGAVKITVTDQQRDWIRQARTAKVIVYRDGLAAVIVFKHDEKGDRFITLSTGRRNGEWKVFDGADLPDAPTAAGAETKFREQAAGLWDAFQKLPDTPPDGMAEAGKLLATNMSNMTDMMGTLMNSMGQAVGQMMSNTVPAIGQFSNQVMTTLPGLLNTIQGLATNLDATLKRTAPAAGQPGSRQSP